MPEPQPQLLWRPACEQDAPAIEALLRTNGLPVAGARDHLNAYVVVVSGDTLLATAGVEHYGDVGLLRSVAVQPGRQGQGLGKRLVERLVGDARAAGVSRLFLLTTTAAGFFARQGFSEATRSAAPAALQASAEFRGACPDSAVLMVLALSPP